MSKLNRIPTDMIEDRASGQTLASQLAENAKDSADRGINLLKPPAPLLPAIGNGVADDTVAIQNIINYANSTSSRKVFAPKAYFLISAPILLNGCTLEGVKSSIFSTSSEGSCFVAKTKDFIAIKQGSLSTKDIQFGVSDIFVKNAQIGFEILYSINSKFERLYAKDCDTGYKLGDLTSVGSMFCDFNNLYTSGTRIGVLSQSKDYFNNNRFNNGFIYGTEKAFHLEVSGGYGAVNNVFNNVELRSPLGRGIVLNNVLNTTFNSVYFEVGGNAIRTTNFCSINLNECVFGLFKAANTNLDTSFIYAEGGFRLKLDGGLIFLTSENDNTTFYNAVDPLTYLNIYMNNNISTNGTAVNFVRFPLAINEAAYKKEKQAFTTSTLNIATNTTQTLDFTFPVPFSKTPDYYSITMRGVSGSESNMHFLLVTMTATGGQLSVRNNSTGTKSVNFRVCAEIL